MSTPTPTPQPPHPTTIGVLLFPGFQLLDAAGPLDILNILSRTHTLSLSLIARTLDPVSTSEALGVAQGSHFAQSLVPTHTFETAPSDLDVLLVPGGLGTRDEANMQGVVEWLGRVYGGLRWCLTVCTGSVVLARTGVLDGRRATSNKKAFAWVTQQHPAVNWVPKARWVVDGNTWSSSGVSAGMDLTFAWVAHVFGEDVAGDIADGMEYERNMDAGEDRFAERWGAV
ncbi:class I glutamine amidotransferase-like protein [Massariosphaeria phaeospora]|uniref:Class I glutamine amidotransferase-like protein n=1 Tax=Massariosphaeria phaeospora TaxID=100035 RepID=A0A7C8I0I1_9PLEO|nr:class I glutamine amidotransferase-like protein [Massariosphaeria phaeospora]